MSGGLVGANELRPGKLAHGAAVTPTAVRMMVRWPTLIGYDAAALSRHPMRNDPVGAVRLTGHPARSSVARLSRPSVWIASSTRGDQLTAVFRRRQLRYSPLAENNGPGAMLMPLASASS